MAERPEAYPAGMAGAVAGLLSGLVDAGSARNPGADIQMARSLANVGLIGLIGLPMLMAASLLVHAPLAGPAVISLGYLAAARALTHGNPDRADPWIFAVLFALVAWALAAVSFSADPLTLPGLAAAFLAPLFAAAPALARKLAARKTGYGAPAAPATVAQCDHPAPVSTVLVLRRSGRPASAVAGPKAAAKGTTIMRLGRSEQPPATIVVAAKPAGPAGASDIDQTIRFAMRLAGPAAAARGNAIHYDGTPGIIVAADRQLCRRIVVALMDAAVAGIPAGAAIHVAVRPLKGAVLVKLQIQAAGRHSAASVHELDVGPARALAEVAGGSVVIETAPDGVSVSLRLAHPAKEVGKQPGDDAPGAP